MEIQREGDRVSFGLLLLLSMAAEVEDARRPEKGGNINNALLLCNLNSPQREGVSFDFFFFLISCRLQ